MMLTRLAFLSGLMASLSLLYAQQPTYTGFNAGSEADQYFGPVRTVCVFNGLVATNPPCMAHYSDATVTAMPDLFYGYSGLPYSYHIPMPIQTGTCDVVLMSYEPNKTAVGQRVFTVAAAGAVPVTIDLFALTGAQKVIYRWVMPSVPIVEGLLVLDFRPIVANPLIGRIQWNCHGQPPATTA